MNITVDLILAIFMLAIGIYLLICGVLKKGAVFYNGNIDKKSEKYNSYRTVVQIFCIVVGLLLVATFVFSLMSYINYYKLDGDISISEYDIISSRYSLFYSIAFYIRLIALSAIVVMVITTMTMSNGSKSSVLSGEGDESFLFFDDDDESDESDNESDNESDESGEEDKE